MSPGDLLLRWVSCYRKLRRARVRAAAERLFGPPVDIKADDPRRAPYVRAANRLTRNLLRLGHVEEYSGDRLLTVPPTIVSLGGGQHILVGARSPALLDHFSSERGLSILRPIPQPDAPAAQFLSGDEELLASVAARLGINFHRDRTKEVLGSLPRLSEVLRSAPEEGIPEHCERWESGPATRRRRWRRIKAEGFTAGLYRTIRKPHQWYLAPTGGAPTVRLDSPERRSAAAWSLVRDRRLRYSGRTRELTLPLSCFGLPLLVDRTLILGSGRLPEVAERGWKYFEVCPERARQVARIVDARLEELE